MNSIQDIIENARSNLRAVIAGAMVALLIFGNLYFLMTSVLPKWQARGDLEAAQAAAEASLNQAIQAQSAAPDRLQTQIDAMRAGLDERAAIFLSVSQANDVLNKLFDYAAADGVEIIEMRATSPPRTALEEAPQGYEVSAFTLEVVGDTPQLLAFVEDIEETAIPGVLISNLNLTQDEGPPVLIFDLLLYTSPYAAEAAASTSEPDSSAAVSAVNLEPLPVSSVEQATPIPLPVCDCSMNLYNCRDFPDRDAAQACYDYCGGPSNDVHRLDEDLNGIACQTVFPQP